MVNGQFTEQCTERLRILLAGRPLSYAEAMRWQKILSRQRRFFPLLCASLLGLLVLELVFSIPFIAFEQPLMPLFILFLAEMAVCAAVVLVKALNHPKQAAEEQWNWYAADVAAREYGVRIEFYETYVAIISKHSRTVMRFQDIVSCVETADGIALNDGDQWVILRAQDMIDFDAKIVKAYLVERLGGERVHCVKPMNAGLEIPLPIPQAMPISIALVTATVPYEKTELYRQGEKTKRRLMSAALVMMGIVIGLLLAVYMPITPWPLLDMVLLCGASAALSWLVSLIMFAWYRPKKRPLSVAFYEDGAQVEVSGIRRFCVKERLYMTVKKQQVVLHFGGKKTIHIPLEAASQPEVLRAFAGISE